MNICGKKPAHQNLQNVVPHAKKTDLKIIHIHIISFSLLDVCANGQRKTG
jgi:hypothetical protein